MRAVKELWQDECGLILSAEAVTVGTLGVLGAVVGLNTASTAVNEELKDFAYAIRSLDQSFGFAGRESCKAWSAGSSFRQQDVQVSLNDLCANGAADVKAIQDHVESHKKETLPMTPLPQSDAGQTVPIAPNKIGVPSLSGDKAKSDDLKSDAKQKPFKKSPKKQDQDESDNDD
ncbi:MAG: hypothetical protein NTZ32_18280 [Planctomycetales bacterium]|nr:hypothetical protein [Planctomycetales bacterium]